MHEKADGESAAVRCRAQRGQYPTVASRRDVGSFSCTADAQSVPVPISDEFALRQRQAGNRGVIDGLTNQESRTCGSNSYLQSNVWAERF